MRGLIPLAAALLLFGAEARAQDNAAGPTIGSAATEAEAQPADPAETTNILVLGDALGGGLGAGLMRQLQDDPSYEVTLRFNELSGIARPELYDWSETIPKLVEGKSFKAIVILVGENDRQEIHTGNMIYVFGGKEWTAAYTAQLDKVMAALKATGSAVYWVSLPPMADTGYDGAMRQVTALQQQRAVAVGLHFVDIRPAFLDANGAYTDRGPDDTGVVRSLRGRDGVSFYKAGNNRLAQLVLAALKANAAAAPQPAKPPQPQPAPAVSAVLPVQPEGPTKTASPGLPLFGQLAGDGGAATFTIDPLVFNTPPSAIAAVQALAPPGSAAEALLVRGISAAPPAGRADDFTVTAK